MTTNMSGSNASNFSEIALEDAEPGMVLFADLTDANGNILLSGGAALSQTTIKSLTRRGVEKLTIVSANPAEADSESDDADADGAAQRERQQQRLSKLFRKCGTDGVHGLFFQYLSNYRLNGQS